MNHEEDQRLASPERDSPEQAPEPSPDPAREALDEPPITAEELEREIGDSEDWDEASQGTEEKS
jgi:hypothetical protein